MLLARVSGHWFDALGSHRHGGRRRSPAMVFLVALVIRAPLSNISPPDPVWIAGIYDDADHNEVVGLVADTTAVGDCPHGAGKLFQSFDGNVQAPDLSISVNRAVLVVQLRSPQSCGPLLTARGQDLARSVALAWSLPLSKRNLASPGGARTCNPLVASAGSLLNWR